MGKLKDISKGTIIRTAVLLLAFINSGLTLFDMSPLPITNEELELVISFVFQLGASLTAWWYDNDITAKAIERKKQLKEG